MRIRYRAREVFLKTTSGERMEEIRPSIWGSVGSVEHWNNY